MDEETARYIFNHFFHLLSDKEKLAWKHHSSTIKLGDSNNPDKIKLYQRQGWLSQDQSVLELLKDGYNNFEISTARKILSQHGDKIFFNKCPKCGQLARTPTAKQCRHCAYDWHDKK